MNANIQLKNDTIDEYTKNPAVISRIKSFYKVYLSSTLSGLAINRFNKILDKYFVLDNKDKSYFFAGRVRKGRKVLFPLVFHAGAGGVANFVTTRERKAVCVRLDYQRIRQIERNSCCRLDSSNTVAKTCHITRLRSSS